MSGAAFSPRRTSAAALSKEQRSALIEELGRYENFTYAVELIGTGTLQACEDALR